MYNKKAQIELTLLVMFVFVSCFPVGFNKFSKQVNINRLVPTLRRRRGIFFLNSKILYQNYRYAHSVRRKTFAQVVLRSVLVSSVSVVSVKMAPPRVANCDWI
jgi:hypothetical protein